ncbi:hypothetical protein [Burkholderia seminalis]|uniref:hypothetical protein n=1 Tax=Burkholderia seminalis TaxID=488731 RepID=UPI001907C8E1|nr:hypothetical protein [Burkholderia seminalis]MBJ9968516.1 hypothetical protein [Burkholderia seminalis]
MDTYHAPSQSGDAELQGLITGLQAFNPALQQYTDFQNQQDAFTAHKAGTAAGELADAGLIDAKTGGIKVPPMPDDLKVEPAFNATFLAGLN